MSSATKAPNLFQLPRDLPILIFFGFVFLALILYVSPMLAVLAWPVIGEGATKNAFAFIERYRTDVLVWFSILTIPLYILLKVYYVVIENRLANK